MDALVVTIEEIIRDKPYLEIEYDTAAQEIVVFSHDRCIFTVYSRPVLKDQGSPASKLPVKYILLGENFAATPVNFDLLLDCFRVL